MMNRYRVILLLGLLLVIGCGQNRKEHPLEVTYIANEGFMIAMGDTKVLVDPLPKSKYYVNPSDTMVARIMKGIAPFDNVDYVLITHDHPDHFNAELMSRFLLNHPAAQFIASTEASSKLIGDSISGWRQSGVNLGMGQRRTIRGDKAEIVAMRLEHTGASNISNLAYVVRSSGYTIVHVGDARLSYNEEYLRTVDWDTYAVDLLFIEYFDQSSETQEIIKTMMRPKYVVLMHIPPGEEDTVRNVNGKIHARTVVFGKENETKRFDTAVSDESSR
jgi:L-ascorbate metabolism protein UlaG (beta-lactamase superfamily)